MTVIRQETYKDLLKLVTAKSLVAGTWVSNGEEIPIYDPTTDEVITSVYGPTLNDVSDALNAAHRTEYLWAHTSSNARADIFHHVANAIESQRSAIANLISLEVGKPESESQAEVIVSASYFRWAAGQAIRANGLVLSSPSERIRLTTVVKPVGVVVAITPWNFPLAMVARKIAVPLALGCPVILKPSEQAPLSALFLAEIIRRAGVPEGVLSVLPTPPGEATRSLLSDHRIRHVSITGSAAAGRNIRSYLAERSVGWSGEFGGNAPVLVLRDVDVDEVAAAIATAKFRNAGQTCVSPNRILVDMEIYDQFVASFTAATAKINVGSWRIPSTTMGPLKSNERVAAVRRHLNDAANKGATVIGGESVHPFEGASSNFMNPAVVLNWTSDMLLAQEETFGPVAPIASVETLNQMVGLANESAYGLASYIFGNDLRYVSQVAEALEYGIVGVNQFANAFANAPIGGWGGSGVGKEGGVEGTAEYLKTKVIAADVGSGLLR